MVASTNPVSTTSIPCKITIYLAYLFKLIHFCKEKHMKGSPLWRILDLWSWTRRWNRWVRKQSRIKGWNYKEKYRQSSVRTISILKLSALTKLWSLRGQTNWRSSVGRVKVRLPWWKLKNLSRASILLRRHRAAFCLIQRISVFGSV